MLQLIFCCFYYKKTKLKLRVFENSFLHAAREC